MALVPLWLAERRRKEEQVVHTKRKAEILAAGAKRQQEQLLVQQQMRQQQQRPRLLEIVAPQRPTISVLERMASSTATAAIDAALHRLKWVQGRAAATIPDDRRQQRLSDVEEERGSREAKSSSDAAVALPRQRGKRGSRRSDAERQLAEEELAADTGDMNDVWQASGAGASATALRRLLDKRLAEAARFVEERDNGGGRNGRSNTSNGGTSGSQDGDATTQKALYRRLERSRYGLAVFERLCSETEGVIIETSHPLPPPGGAPERVLATVPGATAVAVVFDARCDTRQGGGALVVQEAAVTPEAPSARASSNAAAEYRIMARSVYAGADELLPGVERNPPLWLPSGSLSLSFEGSLPPKSLAAAAALPEAAPAFTTPATIAQSTGAATVLIENPSLTGRKDDPSSRRRKTDSFSCVLAEDFEGKRLRAERLAAASGSRSAPSQDWGWRLLAFACASPAEAEAMWRRAAAAAVAAAVLDAVDNRGRAPLHIAAAAGNVGAVSVLLEAGADPNARDHRSVLRTPLHEAARTGHHAVVARLLAAGADAMAADAFGQLPLHLACRGSHPRVVRALLAADAASAAAAPGAVAPATLLQGSRRRRRAENDASNELHPCLSSIGAPVLAKDKRGRKPEDLCRQRRYYVRTLLRGGLCLSRGRSPTAGGLGRAAAAKKSPVWRPVGGKGEAAKRNSPPREKGPRHGAGLKQQQADN